MFWYLKCNSRGFSGRKPLMTADSVVEQGSPSSDFPYRWKPAKFLHFFALNLVSIQNRGIFLSPSAWDRITARAGLVTR